MTQIRFNGRDIDAEKLARVANDALYLLENMTTDDFERGKDRRAREALGKALGYMPDELS